MRTTDPTAELYAIAADLDRAVDRLNCQLDAIDARTLEGRP